MDLGFFPLKQIIPFWSFGVTTGDQLLIELKAKLSTGRGLIQSALLKIGDFTSNWWLYCFWEKIGKSSWTIFAKTHGGSDFTRHTRTSKPRPTVWTCAKTLKELLRTLRTPYTLWVSLGNINGHDQKLMVFSLSAEISRAKLSTN